MENLVYLIGRLCEEPEIKNIDGDKKKIITNLAVKRSYKNEDGIYDTDFIRCILWNGIATHTSEHCKKGDLVGIKGRLQTNNYEENGEKKLITEVLVEKISFLASKTDKKGKQEDE